MKGRRGKRDAGYQWRSPAPANAGRGLAPWVRDTIGMSGVYLIRDTRSRELLYIGESHTDRLHETLTRHLYAWSGRGSGPSYHPARVEVAVVRLHPREANEEQYRLIQAMHPRDNVQDGRSVVGEVSDSSDEGLTYDPNASGDDDVPF